VGVRLALELLAAMQREELGGRYPEAAVRARMAAALRGEQEARAADGPSLPADARTAALRTMMDRLEAAIDRWAASPGERSAGRTPLAGRTSSKRRLARGKGSRHQCTDGSGTCGVGDRDNRR
jgi:hypothetical protein